MLLNFKPQFETFVEEGSKTHSIRGERKDGRVPRVGEICHCYTGLRRKGARLLGRWTCAKVQRILIYTRADGGFSVIVDGDELAPDEKDAFAKRDGFRGVYPFLSMMKFWLKEHGGGSVIEHRVGRFIEPLLVGHGRGLDFKGYVIHWDFSRTQDVSGKAMERLLEYRRKKRFT